MKLISFTCAAYLRFVAFCALALVGASGARAQNVIVNGDFELNAFSGNGDAYSTNGGFSLPGWTFPTGGNQFYQEYGQPFGVARYYSGRQSVSLNGDGTPITLSQNLNTVAGQQYTFSFALNEENVFHTNSASAVQVDLGTTSQTYTLGTQTGPNGYVVFTSLFTADSAITPLVFTDRTPGFASGSSPFLDAVSLTPITAVPEPGAVSLLCGLGISGAAFLRRRSRRSRA